jgi:hypothetical protein
VKTSSPMMPVPCAGPSCRQRLPLPEFPIQVPTKFSSRLDEYAVQLAGSNGGLAPATFCMDPIRSDPNDGYPSTLKRPPRA